MCIYYISISNLISLCPYTIYQYEIISVIPTFMILHLFIHSIIVQEYSHEALSATFTLKLSFSEEMVMQYPNTLIPSINYLSTHQYELY